MSVRIWRSACRFAASYWRAGASLPSRPTGAIFLSIYLCMSREICTVPSLYRPSTDGLIYPALMYAVMFYVILNKRKRLGDCVTFLASGTLEGDTMQRLNALT